MIIEFLAKLCGYDKAVETLIDSFVVGRPRRCAIYDRQGNIFVWHQDALVIYSHTHNLPVMYIGEWQ